MAVPAGPSAARASAARTRASACTGATFSTPETMAGVSRAACPSARWVSAMVPSSSTTGSIAASRAMTASWAAEAVSMTCCSDPSTAAHCAERPGHLRGGEGTGQLTEHHLTHRLHLNRTRAHHHHPLRLSVPQTLQATTDRPPTTSGHQVSYSTEPHLNSRTDGRSATLICRVVIAATPCVFWYRKPTESHRQAPEQRKREHAHPPAAQPEQITSAPRRPRKPCPNPAAVNRASSGRQHGGAMPSRPPCPTLRQRSSRAAEPHAVPSRCTSRPPQRRRSQRS